MRVELNGAKKLYLVVRGGPDGTARDHADWLNPTLQKGSKSVPLSSLKWQQATAGWGQVSQGKSVSGGPLRVGGQPYAQGIGTHANSVIEYDVPAGCTRFTATVGLDGAAAGRHVSGPGFHEKPYVAPAGRLGAHTREAE